MACTVYIRYARQDFFGELAMLGLADGPNGQVANDIDL